ncbi:MAG: ABC transporter permease [Chthoniobacterales bacterium]|nr:ABC transporter permease [Chthoniobacterales bacterium]MCX7712779.1 ABC transporter permease [Chthoniobacterales bacterium]
MVGNLGKFFWITVSEFGDFTLFLFRTVAGVIGSRRLMRRVWRAIYEQGVLCLPVVVIVGLFTGLVLGLQGYYVLNRFGSETLLGALVSLSLTREMAPVLAALVLVGQAGSALAAELGIQRNSEQILALETMGVNSYGYLVTPRILSALVVFPMQTAIFVIVGLWGGWISGSWILGLDAGVYWSSIEKAIEMRDVRESFLKAAVFGFLCIGVCAHQGYNAHRCGLRGAKAVSFSTTRAVVVSSVLILATDYVITSFLIS